MSSPASAEFLAALKSAGVETPALVVDLGPLRSNLERMQGVIDPLPAGVRPHFKAHKSVEIARMQVEAGAVGVTVATVGEAAALLDAGVPGILIANEIADRAALERLARHAGGGSLTVAVDGEETVSMLAAAAEAASVEIGAAVEIDIGLGKAGVRGPRAACELAELIAGRAGLRFDGICGWEGHCADDPDPASRRQRTREAATKLLGVREHLQRIGLAPRIVSAGGTGTYDVTASLEGISDVQPGTYAIMDEYHRAFRPEFEQAVWVVATVISRREGRVVLNAGRKAIASDLAPIGAGAWEQTLLHEEHSGFLAGVDAPEVGELVALVPGDAPNTVNLHGRYQVVEGEALVGEWPVVGRYGDPEGAGDGLQG